MPSPFPGMDPYLEDPALWSGVHQRLMTYIADALQENIEPKYNASIGERLYLTENNRSIYPDVMLVERPNPDPPVPAGVGGVATMVADAPSLRLITPVGVYREPYIEIIFSDGGEVVTALEVLSPVNKKPGPGRDLYLQKQAEILQTRASLVEIDLLATGPHTVAVPEERLAHLPAYRYLVSVRRPGDEFEVYAFALNQRLPRVAVPLKNPDPDVVLDLPAVFKQAYKNGGYANRIDYTKPPKTSLSMMEQTWITERLTPADTPSEPPPD